MTRFQVDQRAAELRRAAGPVAWFVLEELTLDAVTDSGRLVVQTSVRDLATAVSLNKDTVARAVTALVRLGVVEREQAVAGGRFGAGSYTLSLPLGVDRLDGDGTNARTRPTTAHATTHARAHEPAQLSLLDLPAADVPLTLDRRRPAPPQPSDALAPGVPGRPAGRSRDEDVSAGRPSRDESGTPERTVSSC